MIRIFTIIAAVAGLAAFFMLSLRMEKAAEDTVSVANPPPESPFQSSIGASGIVEALGENVSIASVLSGVVEKVFVSVGDTVKKGDSLFQVESSSQRTALASLEKELVVFEAAVGVATSELQEKQDIDRRTERLRQVNVSSDEQTVQAKLMLSQAEFKLAKARADVELARARMEEARAALDRTLVKAPRDGEILRVNVREGEYAQPFVGDSPMVLGETKRLQVRAEIDEYNAHRVRPDVAAVAYPRGERSKSIPLKFSRIEPLVVPKKSLTSEQGERVDTRVLQAIYTFDRPDWPIYAGQQLDDFIDAVAPIAAPTTSPEEE